MVRFKQGIIIGVLMVGLCLWAAPGLAAQTSTPVPTAPLHALVTSPSASVNLRAGAGTDFGVIRAVPTGSKVLILGSDAQKNWYHIALQDGTDGWISAALLTITTTPPTAQIPATTAPTAAAQG